MTTTIALKATSEASPLFCEQKACESEYGTTASSDFDEEIAEDVSKHKGTIGMLGSIAIAVNSLTGPAMVNLPSIFQKAGIIPTTSAIALICVVSKYCSLHMANVISKVPNNQYFTKHIEYSEAFNIFWGHKAYIFTHVSFFFCVTCLNVASIVDCAQVVDLALSRFKGGTMALIRKEGSWETSHWEMSSCDEERREEIECTPFNATHEDALMLTFGYVVSLAIFLPMSLMDLKENTRLQILSFFTLMAVCIQFIVGFLYHGIDFSYAPLWGHDLSDLFGVVLFNFAIVIAVPAWLFEKKKSVSVTSAMNYSFMIGFALYILVGGLGALTMPRVSENMLQSMMSGTFGTVTEVCSLIFTLGVIGVGGIPLMSILLRMNLTGSGLCSTFTANFLSVYLPWGTVWLLYAGGKTSDLLGWCGIIFTSIIVFLGPILLAIHAMTEVDDEGAVKVYGGTCLKSRRSQLYALFFLLLVITCSIVLAVFGELVHPRIL